MVCLWRQPVHEIYIIVLVNLHPYESGSIQFDPFMSVSLNCLLSEEYVCAYLQASYERLDFCKSTCAPCAEAFVSWL